MSTFIHEILWFIFNKPYFSVLVLSNGRKVKRFVQLAAGQKKGEEIFLICKSLKMAWHKPEFPIIEGGKFLAFVDLKNAIPLVITTETIFDSSRLFTKQKRKYIISEDIEKQKLSLKNGNALDIIEIPFPPTVLFQEKEAYFLNQILSNPPSKYEHIAIIFVALIIVVGIVMIFLINSGIKF